MRSRIWNAVVPIASAVLIISGAFLIYFGMFTEGAFWDGVNGGGFYYVTDWRFVIPGAIMIASAIAAFILFVRRSYRESKPAR